MFLYLFLLLTQCFYICFCFNIETQKVTMGQRKGKLNIFHFVTGILIVHQLKTCVKFPRLKKLKHTIHSIIMILFVYQKHTLIHQYQKEIEVFNYLIRYHHIRADRPSNTKRGGVCIYHKEFLGVCLVKLSNLRRCIVCEDFWRNCKRYIGVVYRCPSQDNIEFQNFLSDFDELLSETTSSNSLFT